MMKKFVTLTIAVLLCLLAASAALAETYYVKTDDGKTVNVRWTDDTQHAVMAQLPYGTAVDVLATTKGGKWALVNYKGMTEDGEYVDTDAYIMMRFLSKTYPGEYQRKSSGSSGSSSSSGSTGDAAKILSDMNREFASARMVEIRYTVIARPTRASGWVNLRWAPSTESERIATCNQGKELIVLAETKNWYQVEDPETSMIGFIKRSFVSAR